MAKRSLADIDVRGLKVLVRADLNVPLDDHAQVTDETRIQATLPTLKRILDGGGMPIVMSHLGRPKGEVVDKARLAPVATVLRRELGDDRVLVATDCVGEEVKGQAASLQAGQTLLLENLRFHKGETKNDPAFAGEIASLGQAYVNDAFGTCHRAHASVSGVPKLVEGPAVSGLLVQRELEMFDRVLGKPASPFVAILGGAKVSDKIGVIENLLSRCQTILIGGAMAYTFLRARGSQTGSSLVEEDRLDLARDLMARAEQAGCQLLIPEDHVIAAEFSADAEASTCEGDIPDGRMGLDIGPQTAERYAQVLREAKTVVWNGPMGVFEMESFAAGTKTVAMAVAESDAMSLLGGGDSAAAAHKFGVASRVTHVSTGGGASLELLSGAILPGIEALDDEEGES